MSTRTASLGPAHPWLGAAAYAMTLPVARLTAKLRGMVTADSEYAQERRASMRDKIERGETVYVMGIGPGGHNAGVGLIAVSNEKGIQLIANHEEERFRAEKHFQRFPTLAVHVLLDHLKKLKIDPAQIHCACASWDYPMWSAKAMQAMAQELPGSWRLLTREASPQMNARCVLDAFSAPKRLGKRFRTDGKRMPVINLRHHDNHAWFSWGVSPFAASKEPVMVLVLDGAGDDGAISTYVADPADRSGPALRLLHKNDSIWDSLGMMYGLLSSTQGGWPLMSSEGRYMGAAAWGDSNRLTNKYYARLRDIFVFECEGRIFLNRSLAHWHRGGCSKPYTRRLSEMFGEPILPKQMWHPDAVLRVEDIQHAPITVDRVDKAAAVQLVFEDALFHIVQHLIRTTRSTKLVMTGGTALNCVANMRLLDHFNRAWYERNMGMKDATLHLWVPPVPGDMGVAIGAAYHFACTAIPVRGDSSVDPLPRTGVGWAPPTTATTATTAATATSETTTTSAPRAPMVGGAHPTSFIARSERLHHAFYCGVPATQNEIAEAFTKVSEIGHEQLGNIRASRQECERLADLLAFIVSRDSVVGIFQGAAETGPRALGHRSILANPANPRTLETLNKLVKFRELIRPLAPMATLEAAKKWFELAEGASDDEYNAYNYMVLTTRARPQAHAAIPAVIHFDGTCRVQIVREAVDPFVHAYLRAMGRRVGAEVSVNTSLNVGAPIAQTPAQALETLKKSKGMTGLILVADNGNASIAWHEVEAPPKDAGRTVRSLIEQWRH